MTRRKRLPSIIDSDLDNRFSPSHVSDDETDSVSDRAPTPPPPPKPVKRRKVASKVVPEEPSLTITYAIALFTAAEWKKAVAKRTPKNLSLQLKSTEPFDTVQAQILAKIDSVMDLPKNKITDYDVLYMITRIVQKPGVPLASEADYAVLVEKASGKNKTSAIVNLSIRPIKIDTDDDKENDADAAKKKKLALNEPLPGTVNKTNNIVLLQGHWKCPKKQQLCNGTFCYIDEQGNHISLSHQMLDCWASSMVRCFPLREPPSDANLFKLRGDDCATLERPPNHRLFDAENSALSPVLRRRIEAANKAAPAPASAPVFNITIGKEIVELFHPTAPTATATAAPNIPVSAPASAPTSPSRATTQACRDSYDMHCLTVLQTNRNPGPEMSIGDFCTTYRLSNAIKTKLQDNGYEETFTLRFLTLEELKDIKLLGGEIASVRHAVHKWST